MIMQHLFVFIYMQPQKVNIFHTCSNKHETGLVFIVTVSLGLTSTVFRKSTLQMGSYLKPKGSKFDTVDK